MSTGWGIVIAGVAVAFGLGLLGSFMVDAARALGDRLRP